MPPAWLSEWSQLILVWITIIAAARGAIKGNLFTINVSGNASPG